MAESVAAAQTRARHQDYLNDYVDVMLGQNCDDGFGGVPVCTYNALNWLLRRKMCPLVLSLELLLEALGWLRKPMGLCASQLMWQVAERMKEDFDARDWQGSLSQKGVVGEARSR